MFELPTKPVKRELKNPRFMLIIAHAKCGKTSNIAQVPNTLLVDLENGSTGTTGMAVNVKEAAKNEGVTNFEALLALIKELKESKHKYDYLALDTASGLEEIAQEYAVLLYRKTPMGKTWAGKNVVSELPNGAGYLYLRMAFENLIKMFEGLATKGVILLAHPRTKSIRKSGHDLSVMDINLTGKLKDWVCQEADAIGFMYRKDKNTNVLSFVRDEKDVVLGTRVERLDGLEEVISKRNEDKSITTYWDKILI